MQLRAKVRARLNGNGKSGVLFMILSPIAIGALVDGIGQVSARLAACLVPSTATCQQALEDVSTLRWLTVAAVILGIVGFVMFVLGRVHDVEVLDDSEPGFKKLG